jgi:hypothetical protein
MLTLAALLLTLSSLQIIPPRPLTNQDLCSHTLTNQNLFCLCSHWLNVLGILVPYGGGSNCHF